MSDMPEKIWAGFMACSGKFQTFMRESVDGSTEQYTRTETIPTAKTHLIISWEELEEMLLHGGSAYEGIYNSVIEDLLERKPK